MNKQTSMEASIMPKFQDTNTEGHHAASYKTHWNKYRSDIMWLLQDTLEQVGRMIEYGLPAAWHQCSASGLWKHPPAPLKRNIHQITHLKLHALISAPPHPHLSPNSYPPPHPTLPNWHSNGRTNVGVKRQNNCTIPPFTQSNVISPTTIVLFQIQHQDCDSPRLKCKRLPKAVHSTNS